MFFQKNQARVEITIKLCYFSNNTIQSLYVNINNPMIITPNPHHCITVSEKPVQKNNPAPTIKAIVVVAAQIGATTEDTPVDSANASDQK